MLDTSNPLQWENRILSVDEATHWRAKAIIEKKEFLEILPDRNRLIFMILVSGLSSADKEAIAKTGAKLQKPSAMATNLLERNLPKPPSRPLHLAGGVVVAQTR